MKRNRDLDCIAKRSLERDGVDFSGDFHALYSDQVAKLVGLAKAARYRKPKNASGSTGRMYFQRLARLKGCPRHA